MATCTMCKKKYWASDDDAGTWRMDFCSEECETEHENFIDYQEAKEAKELTMNLINYNKTDIPYSTALNAYRGISFTPEKRAKSAQDSYAEAMQAIEEKFSQWATEENEAGLRADLERYRAGYVARYCAFLNAMSRCMSSMITGPSNFPTRSNAKKNNTTNNRLEEWLEWDNKAQRRLNLDYNPYAIARRPIRSDDADAIEQLHEKVAKLQRNQDLMKAVNKIIRRKKGSKDDKVLEIMAEFGFSEDRTRELFEPSYQGLGFPSYATTNNSANIRRIKQRITGLEREAARPPAEDVEIEGGITITENTEAVRLQIFFPEKPSAEMRAKLKSHGFNFSYKAGNAWQRLLNDNARYAVKQVFGL